MPDWLQTLTDAATDRQNGSRAITLLAIHGFMELLTNDAVSDRLVPAKIQEGIVTLLRGQPSMASLYHLSGTLISAAQYSRQQTLHKLENFKTVFVQAHSQIASRALTMCEQLEHIATYSHSSLVETVLLACEPGLKVTCFTSFPGNEGQTLAQKISRHGHNVTLYPDAAVGTAMKENEVDAVLIGADALTQIGTLNKVGSYPLALCASEQAISVFIVASTYKVWPNSLPPIPIHVFPSDEVWPDHPDSLSVVNRYFEVVDWELVTGVITQSQCISSKNIDEVLENAHLSKDLITLLDQENIFV